MKIFLEIESVLTEVITVKQAAYRYNFAIRTIQQWCDEEKLIAINVENRWLIPVLNIEKHVSARDFYHRCMGQFE